MRPECLRRLFLLILDAWPMESYLDFGILNLFLLSGSSPRSSRVLTNQPTQFHFNYVFFRWKLFFNNKILNHLLWVMFRRHDLRLKIKSPTNIIFSWHVSNHRGYFKKKIEEKNWVSSSLWPPHFFSHFFMRELCRELSIPVVNASGDDIPPAVTVH